MATAEHYDAPPDRPAASRGRGNTFWTLAKPASVRNVVVALLLGAIAAIAGAAISLNHDTVFQSRATLLIDQPAIIAKAADDAPLVKLSLLRLKYIALANTPAITGPAAAQLGMTENAVASGITAAAPPATLVLTVSGQAGNRARASQLADAVANSISAYADQEQQQLNVPPAARYRLTLVQPAPPAARITPTKTHAAKVGIVLGAICTLLAYAIMQLLSASSRSS